MNCNKTETRIEHITPLEDTLSTVHTNVLCDRDGCNRIFKSIPVLQLHQSQFHDHQKLQKKKMKMDCFIEERFYCPVKDCIYYYSACAISKYFAKLRYLKQHYLKVHSTCSYPCALCSRSFSTRAFLRAHQQYCDLDLICSSCKQTFSSITALQTHVRRMGHEAEVLSVYARRIKKKKVDYPSHSQAISKIQSVSVQGGSPSASASASPILPKSQPPHLVAAIALSELAFAGLKRTPTVEVGVQTEPPATPRRVCRKSSSSPIRSRESQAQRRKQTIETETQTRLTNLKGKIRRKTVARKASHKCPLPVGDTGGGGLSLQKGASAREGQNLLKRHEKSEKSANGNPKAGDVTNLDDVMKYNDVMYDAAKEFFQATYKEMCERSGDHSINTSATQTAPGVAFGEALPLAKGESPPSYQMFTPGGMDPTFESGEIPAPGNPDLGGGASATPVDRTRFHPGSILSDEEEEEHLVTMSPSGRISPLVAPPRRRGPSLSAQIRSSSIETQTDHDVFLNTRGADSPGDADDVILTSTETQTESGVTGVDTSSFWCTSETQTCEEFSDIEPFLCSTIHTQTGGVELPPSELFPELNHFTADMQTQTGAHETTQTGDHENTQTGAHEATQTGPQEDTQTGAQEVTQTGANEATQTGAQEVTQIGAHEVTQTGAHEVTQTGAHEVTQTEAHEVTQTGAHKITQTGAHETTHTGAHVATPVLVTTHTQTSILGRAELRGAKMDKLR